MATNPYLRAPLRVTVYDVATGGTGDTWVFLGSVPPKVAAAARDFAASRRRGRTTPAGAEKTLRTFYGSRWRHALAPPAAGGWLGAAGGDRPERQRAMVWWGGEEPSFGDLSDFETGAVLEAAETPPAGETAGETGADTPLTQDLQLSDFGAFAEDTLRNLKEKIYAATGIPPYRQHVFYRSPAPGGETAPPRTTYRVTMRGSPVVVDVRRLARRAGRWSSAAAPPGKRTSSTVAGVPVDRRLEESRDEVRVEALDEFITLDGKVRDVFVADLRPFLEAHRGELDTALADSYQFDLVYYGMIMKFWPELSPEAFRTAFRSPGDIPVDFPLLEPPRRKLRAMLMENQKFTDLSYKFATRRGPARPADGAGRSKSAAHRVAVTDLSALVEPPGLRTVVNVRNVADLVPATARVPAIVARIPAGEAEPGRREKIEDVVVEKRHVSAAVPPAAADLEKFLARPPRRPGVAFAIVSSERRADLRRSAVRFIHLTLGSEGVYHARGTWREDERTTPEKAIQQLAQHVSPLIGQINALGDVALPLGKRLAPPATAARGRTRVGRMTASVYWPRAVTGRGFDAVREAWRQAEGAGVAAPGAGAGAGTLVFYFRRGIANYDPRVWERVAASAAAPRAAEGEGPFNYYARLTDPALAQLWARTFPGRPVRITHRTTDVRVEAAGVNLRELDLIRRYAFAILDDLDAEKKLTQRPGSQPTVAVGDRLRRLQERDPDLYNLRKYDEAARDYCTLCQGDRQPVIYSEAEARRLPKRGRKALTKYWNFTDGVPAYYMCPSARFPHLTFRAGSHPRGYCLPCCKKTVPLPGSKAELATRLCLERRVVPEEDLEEALEDVGGGGRHVLAYGKEIPPGRVSHVPPPLADGLFFDAVPAPFNLRLVGVAQEAPAIPSPVSAGVFYAWAEILDLTPAQLLDALEETVTALKETYFSLGEGSGGAFDSAEDLVDAFRLTFGERRNTSAFTALSPGGPAADTWPAILADVVRIRFDIEQVLFVDTEGDGDVVLEAGGAAAARLRVADRAPADAAVLVRTPAGVYPMFAMDQRAFAQTEGHPARRFFASEQGDDPAPDTVVASLREMICAVRLTEREVAPPGLERVLDFAGRAAGFEAVHQLANLRDMCYGVVLRKAGGGAGSALAYFPVPYSPPAARDAPPVLYGFRPPGEYPGELLAELVEMFNKTIDPKKHRVSPVEPRERLVTAEGETVGFIAGGLYFHHAPTARPLPWAGLPAAEVAHPFAEVDAAIYETGGRPEADPLPPARQPAARRGLFLHYLYRLFVAEFAAYLQRERNARLRGEVEAVVKSTKFSSPRSAAAFQTRLRALLRDHPGDLTAMRRLTAAAYARTGLEGLRAELLREIQHTSFEFDRTTLTRLRRLGARGADGAARMRDDLGRLMRKRVALVRGERALADVDVPNVYAACYASARSQKEPPYCRSGKLVVPEDRFRPFVSVLAADILNPAKRDTLAVLSAGEVERLRFETHPGESIVIR